jgi:hypothetical protein
MRFTRINFLPFRQSRIYTHFRPTEPSKHNLFSEMLPVARNGPSNAMRIFSSAGNLHRVTRRVRRIGARAASLAMLDYFAPVKKWLDEQNQGKPVGW